MIIDYIEEKNRERIARARWHDFKHFAAGFFVGGLIGSAAGLLFAPQSGQETRDDLYQAAADARDKMIDKGEEWANTAKDLYHKHIEDRYVEIKPDFDLEDVPEKADEKIAEGLDSAADVLSEESDKFEEKKEQRAEERQNDEEQED